MWEIIKAYLSRLLPIVEVVEGYGGCWFRCGKFRRNCKPGWYWKFPVIDNIERIATAPQILRISSDVCTTSDGVTCAVSIAVEYSIFDPHLALTNIQDYDDNLADRTAGYIQSAVSRMSWQNIAVVQELVQDDLSDDLEEWGMDCRDVSLTGYYKTRAFHVEM